MEIYTLLVEARCETGEYFGAQVAGELAVKMAKELEAWDHHGRSTPWLGYTFLVLRQHENALSVLYDYLSHIQYYKAALEYHVVVMYNIGHAEGLLGRYDASLHMYQKAEELAERLQDKRKAHGIRHALIDAHLRYGQLDQVPPLLAKCSSYLRQNPDTPNNFKSKAWNQVLRVRFALATNRLERAFSVAKRGLLMARGWPDILFDLHMLMAQGYERLGKVHAAMEEALRARGVSMEAKRFDMEFTAANYVYGLLSSHPNLTE